MSLAVCPEPGGPKCRTVVAKQASRGSIAAKVLSLAPHKHAELALLRLLRTAGQRDVGKAHAHRLEVMRQAPGFLRRGGAGIEDDLPPPQMGFQPCDACPQPPSTS